MKSLFSTLNNKMSRLLPWLNQNFLEPHPSIKDIALQKKSLLLSIFLLVFIFIFAGVDLIYLLTVPGYEPPWYGYVFLFGSYALNRIGKYRLAAALTISMFPIVVFSSVVNGRSVNPFATLYYLVLSIILGSILLQKRFLLLLTLINSIGILLMVQFVPGLFPNTSSIVGPLSTLLIGTALVLVSMFHRDQIEKSRQMELSLNEERLRLALEAAQMGTWDWNINSNEVKWSNSVEPLFGLEPGEFAGTYEAYLNLIHEDDREVVKNEIERTVHGEIQDYQVVHRITCPDCSIRWLEGKGTVYYDAHGKPIRMSGTVTEVTSRKLAEEALRESEQKFRFFVEQSSAGLVLTDEKGIIIEWNSAQESLTGITRGESIGRPLWEIQPKMLPDSLRPPETIQRLKQIIDLALQSGQADFLDEPMEIRLARTDGMKIFVEQTAFSIKTNQGYRLGSISRDITQLKRAEEELIASEEKYRRLVEISPIPMWINEDGIITYLNPAAMKVLGATYPEQIVGKNALDFIHPDYHTIVIERISQITDENIVVPLMEEKYIRLDGSIIDVEVTATPFFTSDTREMQVLFQDITDRKRAENERENLIQELIEKNSELERFTYTVSHDLKSPLITIAGFLGYLEKDAISGDIERLQSDTQRIQNAVNKMERLLNELLELSRIGRLMNPPKKVLIEEIIRDALENVRGQLDAHNVKVKLQPNLPNIYGDRQRLTELMQNLIDNAVKFMGAQPNPQIEIGQQGEEDGFPVFYVKDNGIGIHPKYHEQVFGLFDKLDAKSEGTGIGLALVKRIVEFHGGRIWVESEAGEGSTFYFTLPVSTTPKGIPYQDLRSSRK